MTRVVGRVTTRRRHRERRQKPKQQGASLEILEKRIAEAEYKKIQLEQRMTKALVNNDQLDGHRASKQLKQLESQIESLYEKWLAGSDKI